YGLALSRPKAQDDLLVDGSLLSRGLQRARTLRNATFAELTRDQIRSLVAEEFAFAKKIFPSRTAAFDSLIVEYGARIHDLISTLEIFEDRLHLALLNKEYELDQGFGWKDVSVEMKGPIEKYDPMKVSFLVVDPALEEAGIFDDKGGLGVFDLSLKQHAVPQSAFKVNYRTTQPDAIEMSETQKNDEVSLQRFVDGWAVQDLPPAAQDPLLEKVLKKVPTYTEKEEKMQSKVEQALERLAQGDILPVHEKSACVYCPYKIICRNGASTKEKGERA
ncbi:PD-(D/E)XK nuclease family protein, partial [uncultured Dubosiella sp.]|uniref:PD-(D/E)XK nuclease family protein n=1 Tax=uncultured Dubosiella sp. TaxID=1937011 RepID=UPI002592F362